MRVPDYCEALTAYRMWDAYSNGLLVGQHATETWVPYEAMRASCVLHSPFSADAHIVDGKFLPAPQIACECGVYAMMSMKTVIMRARLIHSQRLQQTRAVKTFVWGTVKLWGRVIEHEHGYRAEYAYPHELHTTSPRLADLITKLYGVPCGVEASLVEDEPVKDLTTNWWRNQAPQLSPTKNSPMLNSRYYINPQYLHYQPRYFQNTASHCDSKLVVGSGMPRVETCLEPEGHAGNHRGNTYEWTDRMDVKPAKITLASPHVKLLPADDHLADWAQRIEEAKQKAEKILQQQGRLSTYMTLLSQDPAAAMKLLQGTWDMSKKP